jgi:phosphoglycerate dehydrogenase-like enzyme
VILATSVVTIAINALIFRRTPRWLQRLLQSERRPPDVEVQYRSQRKHVVVCGLGRVGREVARAFEAFKIPYAVVDFDPPATRFGRERGASKRFTENSRAIHDEFA